MVPIEIEQAGRVSLNQSSANFSSQHSPSTFYSFLPEPLDVHRANDLSRFERLSIQPDEDIEMHSAPLSEHYGTMSEKSPTFLNTASRPISKDQQNLDQDMRTFQNTKLPSQDWWVSSPRSGQQSHKRPSPTSQVEFQSSKRPTIGYTSSFDRNEVSINQVAEKSPRKKSNRTLQANHFRLPR